MVVSGNDDLVINSKKTQYTPQGVYIRRWCLRGKHSLVVENGSPIAFSGVDNWEQNKKEERNETRKMRNHFSTPDKNGVRYCMYVHTYIHNIWTPHFIFSIFLPGSEPVYCFGEFFFLFYIFIFIFIFI